MSLKRDEDYNYSDDDDEASTGGASSNKRQRVVQEPPVAQQVDFDDIDPLALERILSFLDVKSLFRFTFSSRRFKELVTHEHVVRSALISGGHAKKTIMEVVQMSLTGKRTAFLPSPLRLLRLANGKTCENVYCSAIVHHIRPGYGLFFCWDCLVGSTAAINHSHKAFKIERLAYMKYSRKSFVMDRPYTDTAGERAGPILSLLEAGGGNINEILEAADSMSQERRDNILQCLEQATEDHAEIDRVKREGRRNRKDEKKAKAKALVEKIKGLTRDDCVYKDELWAYKEYDASKQNDPSIRFACPFVDAQMKPLVVAPSKGTKRKLKEIVGCVEETVQVIESTGFLSFSFLESDSKVNPWESALRHFLSRSLSPGQALKQITPSMLVRIKEGNVRSALELLEGQYVYYDAMTTSHIDWTSIFVTAVMERCGRLISKSIPDQNARDLAKALYLLERESSDEWFMSLCDTAETKFRSLLPLVAEFVEFIQSKAAKTGDSTAEAKTQFISRAMENLGSFQARDVVKLENMEFESLLEDILR